MAKNLIQSIISFFCVLSTIRTIAQKLMNELRKTRLDNGHGINIIKCWNLKKKIG